MIPFRTPFILPLVFSSFIWRIKHSSKELFLTFDDGPVAGPTEFVLDVLLATDSQATFFCIGDNVRKFPQIFQRIVNEGHRVGNHTYNHLDGWKTGANEYLRNINLSEVEMRQHLVSRGAPVKALFRPPYGRFPFHLFWAFRNFNIVMWDVLTHDYDKNISPENCLRRSIRATRDGSIIVFHDSFKAEKNLKYVLPKFIEHFKSKGYQFKTLPA